MNLRIAGPTPLPPEVLRAVSQQMIDHRGPEFELLFRQVTAWLQVFFETENDLYILTSSGTGGMEAAVVNALSPDDRVLSVSVGAFGDRFATIAEAYGADVVRLAFPMGKAADPETVAAKIEQDGPFAAILLTQNETSTGVTNDVAALCRAIHGTQDPSPLILMDAISGLGAIRLQTDAWGIDVVIAGSQKAWMAPPGLAMISFSSKAWDAYQRARMPRFYFDLGLAETYARRGQTPATPNIAALYGLHASLQMMISEGPQGAEDRHRRIGKYCRRGILDLGLELFADPDHYSNTVTTVILKNGLGAKDVLAELRARYNVICASSKVPDLEMIRIGHMGYVTTADLDEVFSSLRAIIGP